MIITAKTLTLGVVFRCFVRDVIFLLSCRPNHAVFKYYFAITLDVSRVKQLNKTLSGPQSCQFVKINGRFRNRPRLVIASVNLNDLTRPSAREDFIVLL